MYGKTRRQACTSHPFRLSDAHSRPARKKKYTMSITEEHLKELVVHIHIHHVHFLVSVHFTACNIASSLYQWVIFIYLVNVHFLPFLFSFVARLPYSRTYVSYKSSYSDLIPDPESAQSQMFQFIRGSFKKLFVYLTMFV